MAPQETAQPEKHHAPKCPLCPSTLRRVPRSPWMRMIPGSINYYCAECHTRFVKIFGSLWQI